MRLFRIHLFRNDAETFPDPEDVRIDRKGLSPQTKKKKTVNGLRSNPFETFRSISLIVSESIFCNTRRLNPPKWSLIHSEDLLDAPGLLFGQSAGPDGPDDASSRRTEGRLPIGEIFFFKAW